MEHKVIVEIIAKYLGHILAIICLLQIYFIYYIKRKEFLSDLRGKDIAWQLLEISAISWYMLFPTLVIVSLFGLNIEPIVWGSMDFVYMMNLGVKGHQLWLQHKFPKNENSNNKETN